MLNSVISWNFLIYTSILPTTQCKVNQPEHLSLKCFPSSVVSSSVISSEVTACRPPPETWSGHGSGSLHRPPSEASTDTLSHVLLQLKEALAHDLRPSRQSLSSTLLLGWLTSDAQELFLRQLRDRRRREDSRQGRQDVSFDNLLADVVDESLQRDLVTVSLVNSLVGASQRTL